MMASLVDFLQEMLALYSIGLIGFITRKKFILTKEANHVLTQLILHITLPALIIYSLNVSFSLELVKEFFWLIVMSAYILTISIGLAYWLQRRSRLQANRKSVYESLIIFGNQGFIGYAVCFILFQEQGIIYLTMFNICYLLLIWTYGIYLFTKNKRTVQWKKIIFNPGIISTSIGLILFLSPLILPNKIVSPIESIGKMTIPLSMIVIGCFIADIQLKNIMLYMKNVFLWKAAFFRLIVIPLFLLPFLFFSMPLSLLAVSVIVSGMPAAPTISLYAQRYGGDTAFASFGVMITTILCLFTLPFLYILITFLNAAL